LLLGLLSLRCCGGCLRVMPPRPRRIEFPPTRLLFDIAPKEETPSRTPWWLTALRLPPQRLIIRPAAGPIGIRKMGSLGSSAPLAILPRRRLERGLKLGCKDKDPDELIANAYNDRRGVALIPLSEPRATSRSCRRHGARGVRSSRPNPIRGAGLERCLRSSSFLKVTGRLRDRLAVGGVDTGRGAEFVAGLSKPWANRTHGFEGGAPSVFFRSGGASPVVEDRGFAPTSVIRSEVSGCRAFVNPSVYRGGSDTRVVGSTGQDSTSAANCRRWFRIREAPRQTGFVPS